MALTKKDYREAGVKARSARENTCPYGNGTWMRNAWMEGWKSEDDRLSAIAMTGKGMTPGRVGRRTTNLKRRAEALIGRAQRNIQFRAYMTQ